MTEPKLKPCPFCGGKAEQIEARVDDDTKTYSVICTNCMTGIFRPRMKGMQWCAYKTEQEYLQTCNTEQLAEWMALRLNQGILLALRMKYHCDGVDAVREWLKEKHD